MKESPVAGAGIAQGRDSRATHLVALFFRMSSREDSNLMAVTMACSMKVCLSE